MNGILSNSSPGILANRPRLGGFLSNLGKIDNALLGAAAGLAQGNGAGWAGFQQGLQFDQQAAEQLKAEEERQARQAALSGALGSLDLDPSLMGLLDAYPEAGAQFAINQFMPDPVETPDYPSSVDEYLFAQENPDFAAWLAENGGGDTYNIGGQSEVGTIPPGMELFTDAETGARSLRWIQGSPQAAEAKAAAIAAQQQSDGRRAAEVTSANIVVDEIDNALSLASGWTTGLGALTNAVPGTPAFDLKSSLDTIAASVAFDALQEMRNNSPTGGALGAVTERELQLLSSTLGSLNQAQSETQFRRILERLKVIYLDTIHGQGNWTYGPGGEVMVRGAEGEMAPQAEDPDPLGIL